MQTRQMLLVVVLAACLAIGGYKLWRHFGRHDAGPSRTQVFVQTWKCRADATVTNLTLAEIDALFQAGKYRLDPANSSIKLFACPKCGRLELEQTALPAQVEQR